MADDPFVLMQTVDALDAVPEPYRKLYDEKDGKFVARLGGLPDFEGVNGALGKERQRSRDLASKLKAYELPDGAGFIDPAQYKELVGIKTQYEELKATAGKGKDEQVTIITEKLRREKDAAIEAIRTELEKHKARGDVAEATLTNHRIESILERAAVKSKVRPEFLDYIRRHRDEFMILDNVSNLEQAVVRRGIDGEPERSTKDTRNFVTAMEWLEGVAKEKPPMFEDSVGGGAGGGRKPTGSNVILTDDKSAFSKAIEDVAKGKQVARHPL